MVAAPAAMVYLSPPAKTCGALSRNAKGVPPMKDLRSSRRLIKMRQRRERAIDHPVRAAGAAKGASRPTLSAFTASGLAIEDQVRKAWRPWSAGLAIF